MLKDDEKIQLNVPNVRNINYRSQKRPFTPSYMSSVSFGGAFALPEFNLLIKTETTSMDVFGIGVDYGTKPWWHYVVDEECANSIMKQGIYPSLTIPLNWSSIERDIYITPPHYLNNKKVKMKTMIHLLPACENKRTNIKGSNKISADEVQSSFLFNSKEHKCDVTIMIGYNTGETNGSLLLCRFHNLSPTLSNKKKQTVKKLLYDLQGLLKNNGLERRRVGGSSGFTTFSKEMKLLMSTPNSTPRCAKGTVYLKSKCNLKWHVFYLGTKDGKMKYTYYTQPQPGGSFVMAADLMKKYPFLINFASTKPIAAQICQQIENISGVPIKKISTTACSSEMENMKRSKSFLASYLSQNVNIDENMKRLLYYQYYSSKFLNYTLVMHPVGRYHDWFADNKPSLENRVCFSFDLHQDGTTGLKNTGLSYAYGRGGCGINKYCFGIVDWRSSDQNTNRDCWTSEDNKDLKYSSYWYAKEGKVDQRLLKSIWTKFLTNGCKIKYKN